MSRRESPPPIRSPRPQRGWDDVSPIVLMLLGAMPAASAAAPVALPPEDRILSRSSEPIRDGFRHLHVSVRNPPGHFEGIGHFTYVLYGDAPLCQCREGAGLWLSPSGAFAVVMADTASADVFDVATRRSTPLSEVLPARIMAVEWNESADEVTLVFDRPGVQVPPGVAPLVLAFDSRRTEHVGFVAEGPVTAELVGKRGTFRVPGDVPIGNYVVRASWEGLPPVTLNVAVEVRVATAPVVTCNRLYQRCTAR